MVKSKSETLYFTVINILLVLTGLVCVFPLLYVISVSLTPYEELLRQGSLLFIPRNVTFKAYELFLGEPYVDNAFYITSFVTVVGTMINILLTIMMAYPLSRSDLIGKKPLMLFTLIPLLIMPGIIPTYLIVKDTGLINSVWSLIIPTAIWSYLLLITRTFFVRMDVALYEAARIDGASEWKILFIIVLPLSTPIIATIALIYGVGHWNDYFNGLMYMTSADKKPIQVVVHNLLARAGTSEQAAVEDQVPTKTLQMASVVLTSIPVILVYPFLQRYFTKGIMLGAIKG